MECGCGTQMKSAEFERGDDLLFCPTCINPKLIEGFKEAGANIVDYNPDEEDEQQAVVENETTTSSQKLENEDEEDDFLFGG